VVLSQQLLSATRHVYGKFISIFLTLTFYKVV